MKVIINPQNQPRKTYTNLPEREDYKKQRQAAGAEERAPIAASSARSQREERPQQERRNTVQPEEVEPSKASKVKSFFTRANTAAENAVLNDFGDEPEVEEVLEEEQEEKNWKNSRWSPLLFVGALILLGVIGYFAVGYEKDLGLERITVEGARMLTDKEIIVLAGIDRSQRFYDIDLKKIADRIEKHSLIKVAYPRRETNPQTIVLRVEERQPIALMKSEATGEALLIDRDGKIIHPKLLAGLRDPAKLMQVPVLGGISEKDTASYLAMSRLVVEIAQLQDGALQDAIGELRKTPTGSYVIYTTETQTPIFIGSPDDAPFIPALEVERNPDSVKAVLHQQSHFIKQLNLLARVWKTKLHVKLRESRIFYVDARFAGEIVVKRNGTGITADSVLRRSAAKSGQIAMSGSPTPAASSAMPSVSATSEHVAQQSQRAEQQPGR